MSGKVRSANPNPNSQPGSNQGRRKRGPHSQPGSNQRRRRQGPQLGPAPQQGLVSPGNVSPIQDQDPDFVKTRIAELISGSATRSPARQTAASVLGWTGLGVTAASMLSQAIFSVLMSFVFMDLMGIELSTAGMVAWSLAVFVTSIAGKTAVVWSFAKGNWDSYADLKLSDLNPLQWNLLNTVLNILKHMPSMVISATFAYLAVLGLQDSNKALSDADADFWQNMGKALIAPAVMIPLTFLPYLSNAMGWDNTHKYAVLYALGPVRYAMESRVFRAYREAAQRRIEKNAEALLEGVKSVATGLTESAPIIDLVMRAAAERVDGYVPSSEISVQLFDLIDLAKQNPPAFRQALFDAVKYNPRPTSYTELALTHLVAMVGTGIGVIGLKNFYNYAGDALRFFGFGFLNPVGATSAYISMSLLAFLAIHPMVFESASTWFDRPRSKHQVVHFSSFKMLCVWMETLGMVVFGGLANTFLQYSLIQRGEELGVAHNASNEIWEMATAMIVPALLEYAPYLGLRIGFEENRVLNRTDGREATELLQLFILLKRASEGAVNRADMSQTEVRNLANTVFQERAATTAADRAPGTGQQEADPFLANLDDVGTRFAFWVPQRLRVRLDSNEHTYRRVVSADMPLGNGTPRLGAAPAGD